jgi:O-methyltransferase
MAQGHVGKGHVLSPTKFHLAKSGVAVLRATLTFLARILLKEVDGKEYSVIVPEALLSRWNIDGPFRAAYQKCRKNTTVDIYRCYELWLLVGQVAHLKGDLLEVGVWRGGTGCLLAARASQLGADATVFLCDTFKGVVKTGELDNLYKGGEHANTSPEVVKRLASDLGLDNVVVLEGIFPDETGHSLEQRTFRLCHIDVDVYQSAKDVVAWVWPRLPIGGVIVFDDYGFPYSQGITRLVDELSKEGEYLTIVNLNGHAVIVKTPPRASTV